MAPESGSAAARHALAAFGALVSEPSRVAMLLSLMDGSARPATELASIAGVTRPTASAHLAQLLAGRLLAVEVVGRHRYYRLASEQVAEALEVLGLMHGAGRPARAPLSPERMALAEARTCYRHLAGKLGIAWLAALERARLVVLREGALGLTEAGVREFDALGLAPRSWPAGKPCLDWTERRPHLGGPLGTLLTEHLFTLKWIARRRDSRALRITAKGEAELARRFGVRVDCPRC